MELRNPEPGIRRAELRHCLSVWVDGHGFERERMYQTGHGFETERDKTGLRATWPSGHPAWQPILPLAVWGRRCLRGRRGGAMPGAIKPRRRKARGQGTAGQCHSRDVDGARWVTATGRLYPRVRCRSRRASGVSPVTPCPLSNCRCASPAVTYSTYLRIDQLRLVPGNRY